MNIPQWNPSSNIIINQNYTTIWAVELVWSVWRRKRYCFPHGRQFRFTGRRCVSPDTVLTELSWQLIWLHFLIWRNSPQWARVSSFTRFLDHTQKHATIDRTPLDEWSAGRRDLYLTTHDNHNIQTSTSPGGIRTHNLSRRAAADLRLRPRGHWDSNMAAHSAWISSLTHYDFQVRHPICVVNNA